VDEHEDELLVALSEQVLGRQVQQVAADLLQQVTASVTKVWTGLPDGIFSNKKSYFG
jgi:hypothetical protein